MKKLKINKPGDLVILRMGGPVTARNRYFLILHSPWFLRNQLKIIHSKFSGVHSNSNALGHKLLLKVLTGYGYVAMYNTDYSVHVIGWLANKLLTASGNGSCWPYLFLSKSTTSD